MGIGVVVVVVVVVSVTRLISTAFSTGVSGAAQATATKKAKTTT
jgi:hypothetical protein